MEKLFESPYYIGRIPNLPEGDIWLKGSKNGIAKITWGAKSNSGKNLHLVDSDCLSNDQYLGDCATQLREYFIGSRQKFDIEIDDSDWTPFQISVREIVSLIPYGETSTYKQVAAILGNSKKARAVGQANASNPLSIIIPCHRLIGSRGNLRGYAGGLARKKWLLKHEMEISRSLSVF